MRSIRDTTDLQSPLEVEVEWCRTSSDPPLTLSISALMLSKEDIVDQLDDFVFYGSHVNPESNKIISKDHSVTCNVLDFKNGFGTGGVCWMNLELDKIREDINRVRILVSINHKDESQDDKSSFDTLKKAKFIIRDKSGATYSTELSQGSDMDCRCIEVGLVKRYGSSWRFEDELNCLLGGLDMAYDEYVRDDIVKGTPFNQIGNITRIEQRYRKPSTKIRKGGIKTQSYVIPKEEKPWKGKTTSKHKVEGASTLFPASISSNQPVKVKPSRIRKFPEVKNKDSNAVSLKMGTTKKEDTSTMISTRKFPKVKKH